MSQAIIFYPVLALVALTFFVLILLAKARINALKNKKIKISFFKINQGKVPEGITRISQNYDNLL